MSFNVEGLKDINEAYRLLNGIDNVYQNSIDLREDTIDEYEKENGKLSSKTKYFKEIGLEKLSNEQKYDMSPREVDEYNENREKKYEEYKNKYEEGLVSFLNSKGIQDFDELLKSIADKYFEASEEVKEFLQYSFDNIIDDRDEFLCKKHFLIKLIEIHFHDEINNSEEIQKEDEELENEEE